MKALIIDDEQKARNILNILIEDNCPKITQVLQADNLISGVEMIKKERPRLIFLDIEMPGHSGLEILDFVSKEEYEFEIIFTTAYSEYAIQAIQLAAIDYLLKPVSSSKVKAAVEKALSFMGKSSINKRLEELKSVFTSNEFKKIGLPVEDGVRFVNFTDIIALQADGMYTTLFLVGDEKVVISKPLKYFEEALNKVKNFYRPHRSYIINLSFITKYRKSAGGFIELEGGIEVPLSQSKKEEFTALMQTI